MGRLNRGKRWQAWQHLKVIVPRCLASFKPVCTLEASTGVAVAYGLCTSELVGFDERGCVGKVALSCGGVARERG